MLKNRYHYVNRTFEAENVFASEVRINDTLGAFMVGYVNNDNASVVVPKLAINDCYRHYSPGIILINETIKQLITRGIKELDLARGTERYKFVMGGALYHTLNTEISIL